MIDADTARAALEDRLATLLRREAAIGRHLRAEDGRHEADAPDRASLVGGDEVLEGLDDAGRADIVSIRAALARLDDGTWGVCTACGEVIAPGRLAARPDAALCMACAGRVEATGA